MYTRSLPFFIRCVTPLHAGTGSDIGIVDLPIQRERHTNYPKIESSTLKGCFREAFKGSHAELVFGPDGGNLHAGAIAFTDASILLFPVRSAKGVFGLITCPDVINRFIEHSNVLAGKTGNKIDSKVVDDGEVIVFGNSVVTHDGKVIFEEYLFTVKQNDAVKKIAEETLKVTKADLTRVAIVSDNTFRDFVTLSTEVITRNKIDSKTGTVAGTALWNEEYLPAESVLFSFLQSGPVNVSDKKIVPSELADAKEVESFTTKNCPSVLQMGGNATIGKGIVKIMWGE